MNSSSSIYQNDILNSVNLSDHTTLPTTTTTATTTRALPVTTDSTTTIRQPFWRGSRFGTAQSEADALWKNDKKVFEDNWQETYGQPHEAFFYVELVCNIWFIIELTIRFVVCYFFVSLLYYLFLLTNKLFVSYLMGFKMVFAMNMDSWNSNNHRSLKYS